MKKKCDVCGRTYTGTHSAQALAAHYKAHKKNPTNARRSPARLVRNQIKLAEMVQALFPRGIQTANVDVLLNDLRLVESIKEQLDA